MLQRDVTRRATPARPGGLRIAYYCILLHIIVYYRIFPGQYTNPP